MDCYLKNDKRAKKLNDHRTKHLLDAATSHQRETCCAIGIPIVEDNLSLSQVFGPAMFENLLQDTGALSHRR